MLGSWVRTNAAGAKLTENWVFESERTYRGEGLKHSTDGNTTVLEELLLVALGSGVFYQAKTPENELPISFRLVSQSGSMAVFENTAHDFPQRLTYRRTGEDELTVRVEDLKNDGFTLVFTR